MPEYGGLTFRNGQAPALNADNLNTWNDATVDHGARIEALESTAVPGVSEEYVNNAVAGKLNATGTKTVEGGTTFTGATVFSGSSAFTAGTRFGAAAVATDVTVSEATPMFTRFNTTSGAKFFQLPVGVQGGRRYIIGRSYQGSNPLSILPPTNGSINGSTDPYVITEQGETVEIVSLGSGGAWHVVSHQGEPTGATPPFTGTMSRADHIVCYGDSQTAGGQWITELVNKSGAIDEAENRGVSGQSSGSVAVRQGGATLSLIDPVTLASDDAVPVKFQSDVTPLNQRTPTIPGLLAGVRGQFEVVTPNGDTGQPEGTFTPDVALSETVSVPAGTPFVSEDVADHPEWAESIHIIWVGGNDRAFSGANALPGSEAAARSMIARMQTAVDHPRFLVAGPTVYSSEEEGGTMHTRAVQIRDRFFQEWPDNAIDIWGHVRDNGLQILGIEPTQEDLDALAAKSMPPSLTVDNIHYSAETREKVVAPFIKRHLALRGWI